MWCVWTTCRSYIFMADIMLPNFSTSGVNTLHNAGVYKRQPIIAKELSQHEYIFFSLVSLEKKTYRALNSLASCSLNFLSEH